MSKNYKPNSARNNGNANTSTLDTQDRDDNANNTGGKRRTDWGKRLHRSKQLAGENLLPLCTLAGVLAAVILGIIIRAASTEKWTPRQLMYLEFPGEMFLRCLRCLTIPLIFSSLISALGNLDLRLSGQIGKRALVYYLGTTAISITLGIILVLSFHPGSRDGERAKVGSVPKLSRNITTPDTILDLLRNVIPENIVSMTFSQHGTSLSPPAGNPHESDLMKFRIKSAEMPGTNVLGLVAISVVIGIFVGALNRDGRPTLITLFNDFSELTMRITGYVIWATPVGVAFLIMPRIIAVDDAAQMFRSVGLFTLTILCGLFMHGFAILPAIYYFVTRKNPFRFIAGMSEALLTAFGTASSTATLPATINCLEEKNGIDRNVVRFVVPIGATINMDGTALYEAVAAIFIAQSNGMQMDFARVLIVSITATAASVGAAGIPQAGLITMVIVLNALGLPPEDISLVFIIDWLVDRFRTAINVLGDAIGSAVVEHLSRSDLSAFLRDANQAPKTVAGPMQTVLMIEPNQKSIIGNGEPVANRQHNNHDNLAFEDAENEKL